MLHRKNPQFLMAAELVETSRLWARQNAAIQPEWAERLGAHLVKRTYSEPHWSKKRAAVMAYERVTLYGVPLVADRLVSYGKVDAALSRELFIRHALVYGEWHTRHRFYEKNLRLLEEAEELEHRARRRGIVVDEHTLFDFYDARVGPEDLATRSLGRAMTIDDNSAAEWPRFAAKNALAVAAPGGGLLLYSPALWQHHTRPFVS